MERAMRRRAAVAGCAGIIMAGALLVGGLQAQVAVADPDLSVPVVTPRDGDPSGPVIKDINGTLVQRTPNSADGYGDNQPNVYYLNADGRGCDSCHDDLEATLFALRPFHVGMVGGYDNEWNVTECITCHTDETPNWIGTIAPTIHSLHDGIATCEACHEIDAKTGEYKLWEEVKYDYLQGITNVEDPQASFTFDQDYLSETGMPVKNWVSRNYDVVRYEHFINNDPVDESLLDTWTISISGEVDNEMTWTIRDLMENAPIESKVMVQHCEINPLGGDIIGQAEVTGVPLSWILEQAGVTDEAKAVTCLAPDGQQAGYYGVNLDVIDEHEAILAFEINGRPLTWMEGYPACIYYSGVTASRNTKSISDIVVVPNTYDGIGVGGDKTLRGLNKPNVGIINTMDGQVIQAGEPYTFEGWCNAWEDPVIALEFSMDNGATWTRFDTPGCDTERWVHWTYTWTPEVDVDTAYVLQIRGVCLNEDGTTELYTAPGGTLGEVIEEDERTTAFPLKIMVNAKADMDNIEVSE